MSEIKFAFRLAISLFAIGTILFLLFAVSLSPEIAMMGFVYTWLAFAISIAYLLILVMRILTKKTELKVGFKSALILVSNAPIALLYFYLVFALLNCARITFENATGQNLTSIKIVGCQNKVINDLEQGESETVWINIPNDCEINIEYSINGELKRETVASYLTTMNGIIAVIATFWGMANSSCFIFCTTQPFTPGSCAPQFFWFA